MAPKRGQSQKHNRTVYRSAADTTVQGPKRIENCFVDFFVVEERESSVFVYFPDCPSRALMVETGKMLHRPKEINGALWKLLTE